MLAPGKGSRSSSSAPAMTIGDGHPASSVRKPCTSAAIRASAGPPSNRPPAMLSTRGLAAAQWRPSGIDSSASRLRGRPARTTAALPFTCALSALRMSAIGSAVSFAFTIPRGYTGLPSDRLSSTAVSMSGVSAAGAPAIVMPIGSGLRLITKSPACSPPKKRTSRSRKAAARRSWRLVVTDGTRTWRRPSRPKSSASASTSSIPSSSEESKITPGGGFRGDSCCMAAGGHHWPEAG